MTQRFVMHRPCFEISSHTDQFLLRVDRLLLSDWNSGILESRPITARGLAVHSTKQNGEIANSLPKEQLSLCDSSLSSASFRLSCVFVASSRSRGRLLCMVALKSLLDGLSERTRKRLTGLNTIKSIRFIGLNPCYSLWRFPDGLVGGSV